MATNTQSLQSSVSSSEKLYQASQWRLISWKLRRHRLAVVGGIVLVLLYAMALLSPFIAPYEPNSRWSGYAYLFPQRIHVYDPDRPGLRPFVQGLHKARDPATLAVVYTELPDEKHYIRFFARGYEYKWLGVLRTDYHLFGTDAGTRVCLFGTDNLGRDLFSRTVRAASISLSVGLVGVTVSFVLGVVFGGISGFYAGTIDATIQQVIIFLNALPQIPLWMGLSAALPMDWPPLWVYFGVTVILSMAGWTGVARVIRGRMLQLREEAFVVAARLAGSSNMKIIFWHLVPACVSYLIVSITMAIPGMILGETALSFLGLGLREPMVSWGVLLQLAQNVRTVALYPWLLIPVLFVIATTLAFNFLGDGLRDAADPYG